jgi:hypothetical protein
VTCRDIAGFHLHYWGAREGSRGGRWHLIARRGEDGPEVLTVRAEGYVASGAQHTGVGVSADEDSAGLRLFAGLSKVTCGWLTVGSWPLASWARKRWGWVLPDVHIADLRFHDRAIWWEVWHSKWEHKASTPRWRSGNFHWWDCLTGKPAYTSEVTEGPVEVLVPMPEGAYRATVKLERLTWKRPRWPWPKVAYGFDLDVISRPGPDGPYVPDEVDGARPAGYIPVPGKGENAWDCGPDGTFAMSGAGRTVERAIATVVEDVLRDRRRRGAPATYAEAIS